MRRCPDFWKRKETSHPTPPAPMLASTTPGTAVTPSGIAQRATPAASRESRAGPRKRFETRCDGCTSGCRVGLAPTTARLCPSSELISSSFFSMRHPSDEKSFFPMEQPERSESPDRQDLPPTQPTAKHGTDGGSSYDSGEERRHQPQILDGVELGADSFRAVASAPRERARLRKHAQFRREHGEKIWDESSNVPWN